MLKSKSDASSPHMNPFNPPKKFLQLEYMHFTPYTSLILKHYAFFDFMLVKLMKYYVYTLSQ